MFRNAHESPVATGEEHAYLLRRFDNDITAARDCGIRGSHPARLTPPTKPPQAGAFGEEVIVNSEY